MSDPASIDPLVFQPFNGGGGKRLSCSTVTANAEIPGTQATPNLRVLVTNGGAVSAFIRFGQSNVIATLDSMEILPGTTQVFSVPFLSPSGLYVAGITEAGTTKVQITAGVGV